MPQRAYVNIAKVILDRFAPEGIIIVGDTNVIHNITSKISIAGNVNSDPGELRGCAVISVHMADPKHDMNIRLCYGSGYPPSIEKVKEIVDYLESYLNSVYPYCRPTVP